MTESNKDFVRQLVRRNRYLSLATTDGTTPWIAPLEYLSDDELKLYYFSPESSVHSQHINDNEQVAVAIFDAVQQEYKPAPVMRISGVQVMATARKLQPPFPTQINDQIEAWRLPMPPYAVYQITPQRWFIPVIEEGINSRIEVTFD